MEKNKRQNHKIERDKKKKKKDPTMDGVSIKIFWHRNASKLVKISMTYKFTFYRTT